MTRWTSSLNQAEAAEQSIVPVIFVDLDIVGDRQRLNDSNLTIPWGGFDWIGVGSFGGIDGVSESHDLIAQPVKMTLSGVDPQYVTDARTTQYQGRSAVIHVGLLNKQTYALIDTPEEVWSGFMDVMLLEAGEREGKITLVCEHWMRLAATTGRWTDEDQQARYAGDRFFQFLHMIPGFVGKWGARDVDYGGQGFNRRGPSRPVQWF